MSQRQFDKETEIERSIITSFRSRIWANFTKAISEYKLIEENDRIAVCISGGKDSMLLAKCMQLLSRHTTIPFELVYLVMNPGYQEKNVQKIKENAKLLQLPITMFETDIFDIVDAQEGGSPCYLCARMRRGALYRKAQELHCNKIALGHHFDDVIETILMSMLYNGKIQSMMPKLHSDNYEGLELIRPLYYVKEKDIIAWCKKNELEFIRCACHFTEKTESGELQSTRSEMKRLVEQFRKTSPGIEMNIFRSMYNVNIDTAIAYQKQDVTYHFLDEYQSKISHVTKEQFSRNICMYGTKKMENIYQKKVAVIGIGGVGGYVCETLARSGISTFFLYDPDVVSVSNINRQIIADFKTLGKDKVLAMKQRILSINPQANVHTYKMFVSKENIDELPWEDIDYLVDAMDTVSAKIDLIVKAQEKNVPLISSMGAGNKTDPSQFKVMDISKTTVDPLAKVIRKELRNRGINHQKVVCSAEVPLKAVADESHGRHAPGSNPFTPSACGILIAREVFNDLSNQ